MVSLSKQRQDYLLETDGTGIFLDAGTFDDALVCEPDQASDRHYIKDVGLNGFAVVGASPEVIQASRGEVIEGNSSKAGTDVPGGSNGV